MAGPNTVFLGPTPESISNKQLVIVGGDENYEVSRECWTLNQEQSKFVKVCRIPFQELARNHSVCEIPNGFCLTGGVDNDLCVVFEASSKQWKRMENLLWERSAHGSLYMKGKLYVVCGYVYSELSSCVHCLTLESEEWEDMDDSPIAVYKPKVAELEGKLHMLDADSTKRLLQLDVEENEWIELASFPGEIDNESSMIAVNGQLCVAGGSGDNKVCAWYQPTSNQWIMGQQKPSMDHYFGSLVQQNITTLLLLGGGTLFAGTDTIEELNIADGSWSLSSVKMPVKLNDHTALYLNIPQD